MFGLNAFLVISVALSIAEPAISQLMTAEVYTPVRSSLIGSDSVLCANSVPTTTVSQPRSAIHCVRFCEQRGWPCTNVNYIVNKTTDVKSCEVFHFKSPTYAKEETCTIAPRQTPLWADSLQSLSFITQWTATCVQASVRV